MLQWTLTALSTLLAAAAGIAHLVIIGEYSLNEFLTHAHALPMSLCWQLQRLLLIWRSQVNIFLRMNFKHTHTHAHTRTHLRQTRNTFYIEHMCNKKKRASLVFNYFAGSFAHLVIIGEYFLRMNSNTSKHIHAIKKNNFVYITCI